MYVTMYMSTLSGWSCCVCAINSYRNDVILYCAKYSLCRSEYIFLKILVCAILVFIVM